MVDPVAQGRVGQGRRVVRGREVAGDDHAGADALGQEQRPVVPEGAGDVGGDAAAGGVRVEAGAEEKLGAVDVADAGDDRLVHEQLPDGDRAGRQAIDHDVARVARAGSRGPGRGGPSRRPPGTGRAPRTRTGRAGRRRSRGRRDGPGPDRRARAGTARIGSGADLPLVLAHADGSAQTRGAHAAAGHATGRQRGEAPEEVPRAVQAEVHAQDVAGLELEEQLLADRPRRLEHLPVEASGAGGEPPLGRGDRQPVTDEVQAELTGDAVDGMTLGHARRLGHGRSVHRTRSGTALRRRADARRRLPRRQRPPRRRLRGCRPRPARPAAPGAARPPRARR